MHPALCHARSPNVLSRLRTKHLVKRARPRTKRRVKRARPRTKRRVTLERTQHCRCALTALSCTRSVLSRGCCVHRPSRVRGTNATEHSLLYQNPPVGHTRRAAWLHKQGRVMRAAPSPLGLSVATEKSKLAVAHCFGSSLPLQKIFMYSFQSYCLYKFIQIVKGPENVNTSLEQS